MVVYQGVSEEFSLHCFCVLKCIYSKFTKFAKKNNNFKLVQYQNISCINCKLIQIIDLLLHPMRIYLHLLVLRYRFCIDTRYQGLISYQPQNSGLKTYLQCLISMVFKYVFISCSVLFSSFINENEVFKSLKRTLQRSLCIVC